MFTAEFRGDVPERALVNDPFYNSLFLPGNTDYADPNYKQTFLVSNTRFRGKVGYFANLFDILYFIYNKYQVLVSHY